MSEQRAPRMMRRAKHVRRRPRWSRIIGGLIVVAGLGAALALSLHVRGHARLQAAGLLPVVPAPQAASESSPSSATDEPRWEAFAHARGIRLYLPAEDPVEVTYHEASFHNALALHPLGHIVHNYNKWKFDSPKTRTPGPNYIVMSSRGRPTPATSAADVVLRRTTPFRSPVTGRVVSVEHYHLYCRYPDFRVAILPDGERNLTVTMIHLRGLRIRPGDRVFATLSVIGFPRVFPFRSQVDDYIRGGNPHVHIEITRPHKARRTAC